jgi:hypothetical protein
MNHDPRRQHTHALTRHARTTAVASLAAFAALALPSCAAEPKPGADALSQNDPQAMPAHRALAQLMEGRFSSAAQASQYAGLPRADRPFFEIDVRVERIEEWEGADGAVWMYMEQAVPGRPPYRQRIYRLDADGPARATSRVLWLPGNASRFVGAESGDDVFGSIGPSALEDRGCVVVLDRTYNEPDGALFVGETAGDGCPSDFGGATRATSTVRFSPSGFTAWDQGWNEDGEQVWGPTEGPYVFDRVR